jgi:hypothetical protein
MKKVPGTRRSSRRVRSRFAVVTCHQLLEMSHQLAHRFIREPRVPRGQVGLKAWLDDEVRSGLRVAQARQVMANPTQPD